MPTYNHYLQVMAELGISIESLAARHAATQGIKDRDLYRSKGYVATQVFADLTPVTDADSRARFGAAILAAMSGSPLPASLVPPTWEPVDALLEELGFERPQLGR